MPDRYIIISGPSGAGKTTLVQHLLAAMQELGFSVSACSRKKREHETNGKDYYFIPVEPFRQWIAEDAFLEWEEVYPDHFYGSLKSEVDRIISEGKFPLFDVDVVGALNIKKHFGSKALAIIVVPPSVEMLKTRLSSRKTETEDKLKLRLEKVSMEMARAKEFDHILVNDDLEKAKTEAEGLVRDFLVLSKQV